MLSTLDFHNLVNNAKRELTISDADDSMSIDNAINGDYALYNATTINVLRFIELDIQPIDGYSIKRIAYDVFGKVNGLFWHLECPRCSNHYNDDESCESCGGEGTCEEIVHTDIAGEIITSTPL